MGLDALIFDVDGTLAETEEAHRHAFTLAFADLGLNWRWDQALYKQLLKISGGRERISAYDPDASPELVAALHRRKTQIYTSMVATGRVPFRPGIETLFEQARDEGVRMAIASTTSRANVEALLGYRMAWFEVVTCGEDAPIKKPDPSVYVLTLKKLGLKPEHCLALEDSANGVKAARGAGLKVVVTPSLYTRGDRFDGALRVLPDLSGTGLAQLRAILG